MDIKSANYWLEIVFIDLKLPQNRDRPIEFISWFAEHYVLPIRFEYLPTQSIETISISIESVMQTFQRTKKLLLFSIHVSEWGKID